MIELNGFMLINDGLLQGLLATSQSKLMTALAGFPQDAKIFGITMVVTLSRISASAKVSYQYTPRDDFISFHCIFDKQNCYHQQVTRF